MEKRITIIGNYGKKGNDYNGQLIRTQTIAKSVEKYMKSYSIIKINTLDKSVKNLILAFYSIIMSEKVIILPAKRSLKKILKVLNILNAEKKTIHIPIGGWLHEYIQNNRELIEIEKKMITILVQTKSLKMYLEDMGLRNVEWFPNYRNHRLKNFVDKKYNDNISKFVYYARVSKEKGIIETILAINRVNIDEVDKIFLDVYGPIQDGFDDIFKNEISGNKYVEYKGVLEQDDIISTLKKYDCMIFPTYYEGEGFPGTLLEAMISGVPVITSDWKYNNEIVKNGENGLLCKIKSVESIVENILILKKNPKMLINMSKKCIENSKDFMEDKVIEKLINCIVSD